jgi:hypothetical protein
VVSHVRGRVSDRLVQSQSDGKSTDQLRVFASDSHFNDRNCKLTIMVVLQRVAGASTNEEAKRCLCRLLEFQELFCHVKNNGCNFDNLIFF